MSIAWLFYVLLVGVLLAAAASALASAARALGRQTRWVWAASLGGTAMLAVLAPRNESTAVTASVVADAAAPMPLVRPDEHGTFARLKLAAARVEDGWSMVAAEADRRVPPVAARAGLVIWLGTSSLLLALFAGIHHRLSRRRRRWDTHRAHGVSMRVSPTVGPAVLGLVNPEIVVPRSLLERSAEEQRLILTHEREHLVARDHLLLAGACLVAITLPWHPAVWYLLGKVRLAIELDCDARVLRGGAPARRYGALLIDMASMRHGIHFGTLALADGPSHLERRIRAMKAPVRRHAKAYGAVVAGVAATLVFVACEARVPTSAEIASMDVATAQRSAADAGFIRTPNNDRTDFFIDGVKVSAEQARALEARQIGSIMLVKSALPNGRDTMLVVTPGRMSIESKRVGDDEADPFEAVARKIRVESTPRDSTEKIVANLEQEQASQRVRTGREPVVLYKSAAPAPEGIALRGGESRPLIIIDGKKASETELAALQGHDIAEVGVYKTRDRLPASIYQALRGGVAPNGSVIAVTTKRAKKQ